MAGFRHFLDLADLDAGELRGLLAAAAALKADRRSPAQRGLLAGRVLAMIFEKPSMRTRVSFEVAMLELGGHALMLSDAEIGLGTRESPADTGKVLSRYVDAIMIRTHEHTLVEDLAEHAQAPVINGLTARSHPCQVVADLMTVEEHIGPVAGCKVAWCGDFNNVAVSWVHAAARLGFTLSIACPAELSDPGIEQDGAALLDWARALNGNIELADDPLHAVGNADCVVADTWVSMGADDKARREKLLAPFQVTDEVMGRAKANAIFLHCLPAYRGREVSASVIDGPRSAVFDEAENRLHAQKAILLWCLRIGCDA